MFTGIVERTGRIVSLDANDFGVRLLVDPGEEGLSQPPQPGDSVAINGCCLTHAPHDRDEAGMLAFDVIKETLAKTTLGNLAVDSQVNLETSLTPATAMGGHFVQGHIDGMGTVASIETEAGEWRVAIKVEPNMVRYVVPKGSITIEGVSLTIAAVDVSQRTFEVALIPTTLELTTLDALKPGHRVNLESDMIARTVVHWLEAREANEPVESLTKEVLFDAGFGGPK